MILMMTAKLNEILIENVIKLFHTVFYRTKMNLCLLKAIWKHLNERTQRVGLTQHPTCLQTNQQLNH